MNCCPMCGHAWDSERCEACGWSEQLDPINRRRADTAAFYDHLDVCPQCRNHPMALCAVGALLLHGYSRPEAR